jgi:D-lactate dehydrogenase (cytochrome)
MIVKTEPDELQNYLIDASNMPGGYAERLFLPETVEETAEILKEADERKIPVTVSGARTGTVGGAVPFGGYIISLEKLDKIREINRKEKFAVVESGVRLSDFQRAVEAENLFYPPDPTEWSCQIGGTVATNASGARSFKYGATRNYVEELELVLAGGEILDLKRGENFAEGGRLSLSSRSGKTFEIKLPTYPRPDVRKNVSGYFTGPNMDAVDLFGVITRIKLRLLDKPESFFSGIVFFENETNLLNFVAEARELSFENRKNQRPENGERIDASLIEYFDERALKFISEKFPEVPASARGAIFFEQETSAENEDKLLEAWNALLEKHAADLDRSWFTTTEEDRAKMREFRHALPVAVNERIVRYRQKKVGTDMAVPDSEFASFLKFYREMLDASGLDYVIFGHIGDNHLHANLLPKSEEEAVRARHLYGRFIAQALMLGGTVSAEHGIGKHKSKYLYVMMGERYLNEMAELKKAFDPNAILGRGNMFDEKFLN